VTAQIKKVKSHNRYPNELKRKIAKEYLSGAASHAVLAEEHGLRDKGVVKELVKWYRRKYELGGENEPPCPKKNSPNPMATSSRSRNKSRNSSASWHFRS
jgi:transposase-like protein